MEKTEQKPFCAKPIGEICFGNETEEKCGRCGHWIKPIKSSKKKDYLEKLLAKFKKDPQYELKQEFGMMLIRNIKDFSPKERERYDELKKLLK